VNFFSGSYCLELLISEIDHFDFQTLSTGTECVPVESVVEHENTTYQ